MTAGSLLRLWRRLWGRPRESGAAPPVPTTPPRPTAAGGRDDRDDAVRVPLRRRYTAPRPDDPRREADLGAVLQALAGGPLPRAELGRRVDGGQWSPDRWSPDRWSADRLDAVVEHGLATGVLLVDDDGTVRARYLD